MMGRRTFWIAGVVCMLGLLCLALPESLGLFRFFLDSDAVSAWLVEMGPMAPCAFIGFQVLQVVLAPIPGEASGVVGGYLFGFLPGFLYSSIGLGIGSLANLLVARMLGGRVIRKRIPDAYLLRFDRLVEGRGLLTLFFLFVFPGFPKDYLCLFLGLSRLPMGGLLLVSVFGRMPGTLILSLQGAYLHERLWIPTLLLALVAVGGAGGAHLFRKHRFERSKNGK